MPETSDWTNPPSILSRPLRFPKVRGASRAVLRRAWAPPLTAF